MANIERKKSFIYTISIIIFLKICNIPKDNLSIDLNVLWFACIKNINVNKKKRTNVRNSILCILINNDLWTNDIMNEIQFIIR